MTQYNVHANFHVTLIFLCPGVSAKSDIALLHLSVWTIVDVMRSGLNANDIHAANKDIGKLVVNVNLQPLLLITRIS